MIAFRSDPNIIFDTNAHALFFNENITSPIENWPLDQSTNTINEIKSAIVWENCIIHPSVCMRTDIAKSLLYDASQKNYEDYDLWLRLLANNHIIAKINEPLLYYRVQENSVTQSTIRKSNFFFYKAKVKFLFINKCISNYLPYKDDTEHPLQGCVVSLIKCRACGDMRQCRHYVSMSLKEYISFSNVK